MKKQPKKLPPAAIAADRAARIIGFGGPRMDDGFDAAAVSWLTAHGYTVATWTETGGATLAAVRPPSLPGPFGEFDGMLDAPGATPRDALANLVLAVAEAQQP